MNFYDLNQFFFLLQRLLVENTDDKIKVPHINIYIF